MFGENQSQKELREEWPKLSYEEKVDKFLWKMSWYHSNIQVSGSPPHEAINKLAVTLKNAAESSDNLTKSIRTATWVGGIAAALGVIVAAVSIFVK